MVDCVASRKKYLPNSKSCFVCGEENAAGLRTRFFVEDNAVKTRWKSRPHHCGYTNIVHGGVVAALLDECMAWAATRCMGRTCVTGELSVRYFKRVPGNREIIVCAEVAKPGRRLAHVKATIVDDDGEEYAQAYGRFAAMSVDETLAVDDGLLYRGGEERVFDDLRAQHAKEQSG